MVASPEANLRLLHFEGGLWVDVTTSLDTLAKIICGRVSSVSGPFALAASMTAIPQANFGMAPRAASAAIVATIDVVPQKWDARADLAAKGRITVRIGNLAGHGVSEIDPTSIRLNATVATVGNVATLAGNGSGPKTSAGPSLQVQFDSRAAFATVGSVQPGQTVTVTVTGRLANGARFQGQDSVTIVGP